MPHKAVKKKETDTQDYTDTEQSDTAKVETKAVWLLVWFVLSLLCSLQRSTLPCGFVFSSYLTLLPHTIFHPTF